MDLAYSHFKNFFVTHGHIPAIFNLLHLTLSELSHSQRPQHSKTYLQSLKPNRKLVSYYGKVKETNFTSVKKAKMLSFLGTKRCRTEKLILKPLIFLEILKAVCLSFDLAPKLIQINFQIVEQKLVQRCETEVVGDACKASYRFF